MNKKEFVCKVAETLRNADVKKPIHIKKHTFHITDDEGNSADFNVKQFDKMSMYTIDDVMSIVEACMEVMIDAMKNGEDINISGFGSLRLHYRAARKTKEPGTGEWCDVEARYVPKFFYGAALKQAALVYSMHEGDEMAEAEAKSVVMSEGAGE